MSIHNVYTELSSPHAHPSGGAILVHGATVPTDGATGYAKGCIFVNTANTNGTDLLYVNIGTVDSCNFDVNQVA